MKKILMIAVLISAAVTAFACPYGGSRPLAPRPAPAGFYKRNTCNRVCYSRGLRYRSCCRGYYGGSYTSVSLGWGWTPRPVVYKPNGRDIGILDENAEKVRVIHVKDDNPIIIQRGAK